MKNASWFSRAATATSRYTGKPLAFALAAGVVVVWGALGPVFHFSDTWQLVMNTTSSLVTFLMVFLIQSSQNRDTEAMQIKLDELIRATQGAQNALLDLEQLETEDIDKFRESYTEMAAKARDSNNPEVSKDGIPEINLSGLSSDEKQQSADRGQA